MNIAVIGSGYVGLVLGACLAESGNDVISADIDEEKVARLNRGEIPIYEPGLEPLIRSNLEAGRLRYTTDVAEAVRASEVIFIAVGTPPGEDGSADLKHVLDVASAIGGAMNGEKIVVTKSTVPVGTARRVRETIEARTDHPVHVCSNPEFLKEGAAVEDFMKPDRVVLGVDSEVSAARLRELYEPFVRTGASILMMDVPAAEITKYAANAMLATRISFMNAIAQLCEAAGADVTRVRMGVGSDRRIGPAFLFPGAGYGGSCFHGAESLLVREDGRVRLVRFRDLFAEYGSGVVSSSGRPEPEVAWTDDLEVLSWCAGEGPVWRRVAALTRRWYDGDLLEVRTKMGRRVRCTPDHPFIVRDADGGSCRVVRAEELDAGDWLPLALGGPAGAHARAERLAVAAAATRVGIEAEEIIARIDEGVRGTLARASVAEAVTEHPRGRNRAYDILRTGALRLPEMERLGLPPEVASFGTARNGTYVPAFLEADEAFWRVVGLYLAEGWCTCDGRRMRLRWAFHPTREEDLVNSVAGFWRGLGVKATVTRTDTAQVVSVSSRILARWWLRVLRLGANAYAHRLPDAVWTLPRDCQLALLSGLWHGDGSWSLVNGGPSVVLEWGTASRELADGVLRLLGNLGIVARLKVGRASRSTVDTYWLVVSGADQVERLLELVKPEDRSGVVASIARQRKRIRPTGYRPEGRTAWLRVTRLNRAPFRGWVYSAEVPGTETLVTTGGLVVHNCFPKDVQALIRTMDDLGADSSILQAVEAVNERQKGLLARRLVERLGEDLSGVTVAVWGLAFKPNTDDMREAPSLVTLAELRRRGAEVVAHDPVAMDEARRILGDGVRYADTNYQALEGADALVIHTEWLAYRHPDFDRMLTLLRRPLIFDGRNLWDPDDMAARGFEYWSVGRPVARPGKEA